MLTDVSLVSANFALAPVAFEGAGPRIDAEPESIAAAAGATARFRVLAAGDGLTYSWLKDGVAIPGATASTLVLSEVTAGQGGLYRAAITGAGVSVQSKPARLTVATEVQGQSTNLANLSVRAFAADGGAQLIAGLSIHGMSAPHRMLIRGIGPGLAGWISRAAKDPAVAVRNASGELVAENDDWGQTSDQAALRAMMMNVGAFGLDPASKDAALMVPLGNENYTVLVRDRIGGPAIVECYDADASLPGGFGNLSARAEVRTEALIAGIEIGGGGTMRLLVRAIGPTLARFGVADVFANPTLRLVGYGGDVDVASNSDWSTSAQKEELRTAFASVGAFPLDENSLDAALVVTVPAGVYTAVVDPSPFGGTVLVEVYRLPNR